MRAVLFTDNNARILQGSDAEAVRGLPNVIMEPDLSEVTDTPPHFWKLVDGKVKVQTADEQGQTLQDHAIRGVINHPERPGSRMTTSQELSVLKVDPAPQEAEKEASSLQKSRIESYPPLKLLLLSAIGGGIVGAYVVMALMHGYLLK